MTMAIAIVVVFVACVVTFLLVRFLDIRNAEDRMHMVLVRNRVLADELERLLGQHDFLSPHLGESCQAKGCPINFDKTRATLERRNENAIEKQQK